MGGTRGQEFACLIGLGHHVFMYYVDIVPLYAVTPYVSGNKPRKLQVFGEHFTARVESIFHPVMIIVWTTICVVLSNSDVCFATCSFSINNAVFDYYTSGALSAKNSMLSALVIASSGLLSASCCALGGQRRNRRFVREG